jgi:hypothetical protein
MKIIILLVVFVIAGSMISCDYPYNAPPSEQEIENKISIGALKDCIVHSIVPNTTADDTTVLGSYAWSWNGEDGYIRGFIQFDLSAIPKNKTIKSAKLYLYHHDHISEVHDPRTFSNVSYLQRVTTEWDVKTITWNNMPSATTINQVTLPESKSATEDYIVDVTLLIQDMCDYENYGMMLILAEEQTYARLVFSSSDAADSTLHPKLVVAFE